MLYIIYDHCLYALNSNYVYYYVNNNENNNYNSKHKIHLINNHNFMHKIYLINIHKSFAFAIKIKYLSHRK